jgi:hypothetical protein
MIKLSYIKIINMMKNIYINIKYIIKIKITIIFNFLIFNN